MVKGHHGIGHHVQTLIESLKELGHKITILSSSEETEKVLKSSYEDVIRCKLPFAHPAECLELSQKAKHRGFDILHFSSFAVPLLKPGTPYVVTIHDLIHLKNPSLAHKIYYNTILKSSLSSARAVMTISQWTKDDVCRKLGVAENKVHVVRIGLEKIWFEHGPSQKLAHPPTFLVLSNLKEHKNVKTLLKACRDLWRQGFNFQLEMSLGGQDLPEEWKSLSSRIKILKNVTDEELLDRIRKSWGILSPSFFEGYDYPVAQALVQGKPAILSRGSAHDEFRGSMLHFYGEPEDTNGLMAALRAAIKFPRAPVFDHNIITQRTMAEETEKIYKLALHF
jgi:glycosyltransferase involved in cell wall biosynthesis